MVAAAAPPEVEDPRLRAPIGPADGPPYIRFLKRLHLTRTPEWYFEIGTAQGNSLRHATCKAIAVDPKFQIYEANLGHRAQTHLFEMTSDAFFDGGHLAALTQRVDLAFLDGMHLFEFLLRDFINTERFCTPDSVVVLHDLVPPSYLAAERDWDRKRTKLWTGDVWKVGVILREYRPDLDFRVANCRPSGLGLITGLDPANRVLSEAYDEIVARFSSLSISDYGEARLAECLDVQRANGARFTDLAGNPSDPRLSEAPK